MSSSSSRTSGSKQFHEPTVLASEDLTSASKRLLKTFAVLLLLAAAVGCLLLELVLHFRNTQNTLDFMAFYIAGSILHQGSGRQLYEMGLQLRLEHHFLSQSAIFTPFYHPPFEAWFFESIARLPLSWAFVLWSCVNLVVLGWVFYLLRFTGYRLDQDRRLVWLVASLPAVAGVLVKGQDSLLLVPIFLLGFLSLKKRHEITAGLIFGAGLFRFEIMLPFLFIFLLRRRWKVMAGFTAASAVCGIVSLATVGWNGLVQYAKIIEDVGRARGSVLGGDVAAMPSLRGAMSALLGQVIPAGFFFPLVLVLTLLLLGWAAWEFKSFSMPETRGFDLQFSMAVIAAVIASYHLFVYMLTPLLVVAFLVLGHERSMQSEGFHGDRAGTILVLLLGLIPIVGSLVHFYHFMVLFIVMLGLAVWCAQENAALGKIALEQ